MPYRKYCGSVSTANVLLSVTTKESPDALHSHNEPLLSTMSRSFWRNALSGFFAGLAILVPAAGFMGCDDGGFRPPSSIPISPSSPASPASPASSATPASWTCEVME